MATIEASEINRVLVLTESMHLDYGDGITELQRPRRVYINGERLIGNAVIIDVQSYDIKFDGSKANYMITGHIEDDE